MRAAVGSLGVCDFASLRSAMPAGGRRSEPLRHDRAARETIGRRRGSAGSLGRGRPSCRAATGPGRCGTPAGGCSDDPDT